MGSGADLLILLALIMVLFFGRRVDAFMGRIVLLFGLAVVFAVSLGW